MSEQVLRAAVCDDEETALEIIANTLSAVFESRGRSVLIDKYRSPADLEKHLAPLAYDLLFLDIRLENTDGIDFARKIRKAGNDIDIIFLSSCEERVFDTFSVGPFGFIRKANFLKDASEIIDSYLKKKQKNSVACIVIQAENNKRTYTVPVTEITYIECYRHDQIIHLKNRKDPIVSRGTLSSFEEKLLPYGFLRAHKAYLVNYRFIREIGTDEMKLSTGAGIPINRRNAARLREEYLALMQSRHSLIL